MATNIRYYADPNHEDYLLLWQYRQSSRFLDLVTAVLNVIQSGRMDPWTLLESLDIDVPMNDYRDPWTILESELNSPSPADPIIDIRPLLESLGLVDPWPLIETKGNIETADGWWLDRIGERLGLSRSFAISEEGSAPLLIFDGNTGFSPQAGQRWQWSPSMTATGNDAVHFSGPTIDREYTAVMDDQYRNLLSAQALANRRGRSIVDIEAISGEIFEDGVWVEETGTGAVDLHVIADTNDFVNVIQNNRLLPRPAGVRLDVQWHQKEAFGLWGLQDSSPDRLWKFNLENLMDNTGVYDGQSLPGGLTSPRAAAGYNGYIYAVDRTDNELWIIDPLNADSEIGRFGAVGTITTPNGMPSNLIFPSGMTLLNGDLYIIDGDRNSRRIFRFTSLRSGSVTIEEVGQINVTFNASTYPPRCLAALGGDFYVGFAGSALMSKVDPSDVTRTTDGYGTLSLSAVGSGGRIFGMCMEPGRDDALLLSTGGTGEGLWRINPNNFADTSGDYGQISTWTNTRAGVRMNSLLTI